MVSSRRPLEMEIRRVTSFDGTDIAYRVTPAPSAGARTVVLAGGLGGSNLVWRAQMEYLADRYRFLTWDYRGLYASKRPSPDVASAYSIAHHVRDLAAILAAERLQHGALVGWSMGVQVALEACRMLPGFAQILVLLGGTYRRPLETLSSLPGMGRLVPSLVDVAGRLRGVATTVTRTASQRSEALGLLRRMGLLSRTLDPEISAELVRSFGELDMAAFFKNLRALDAHDAEDVLPGISVPTLIMTGDRDAFTPVALAQSMARRIPTADILVVRGGSHYMAMEYPDLVSLRIERFFTEHGF
jgi:pimeloyl-ACP methyl ester carboxylesterase